MQNKMISILMSLSVILCSVAGKLTVHQKRRCEQYTSANEFNSIRLKYDFCLDLNDGNGITAGRSFFTTKSGDVYQVVHNYTLAKPNNPLSKFESELFRLKELKSGDTTRLKDFDKAWEESANDLDFRSIQDRVNDQLYYIPAMNLSANLHLKTGLSKCIIYDTVVRHGMYRTINTFRSILSPSHSQVKNRLVSEQEEKWVLDFLEWRGRDSEEWFAINNNNNNNNSLELEVWDGMMARVDALFDLVNDRNWDLDGPIGITDALNSTIVIL